MKTTYCQKIATLALLSTPAVSWRINEPSIKVSCSNVQILNVSRNIIWLCQDHLLIKSWISAPFPYLHYVVYENEEHCVNPAKGEQFQKELAKAGQTDHLCIKQTFG